MIKLTIAFITISLFLSVSSKGQNLTPEEEKFFSKFSKEFRVPRDIVECQSFLTTMIIPVKNNHIDTTISFSEDTQESLKRELIRTISHFKAAELGTILQVPKGIKDYAVLLPVAFYADKYCAENMTSDQYKEILRKGLNIQEKGPFYILKAIFVGNAKAIQ